MAKLEVLLATTDQSNFDKLEEMNIQSDIIIANQSDFSEIQKTTKDGKNITMISTTERGVGRNRNLAMLFSSGDICILADDDMRFDDDYTTIVEDAFENNPRADIIIFNIDTIGDQSAKRRNNKKVKRIRIFNCLNYGAARIAYRRESIEKVNLSFSLLFGGGCKYCSGEDSLFLTSALRSGLKIYTFPKRLATVLQTSSSWFTGYNEKYFHDKGCWVAAAFRRTANLWAFMLGIRFRKANPKIRFPKILKLMFLGIRDFKKSTKRI